MNALDQLSALMGAGLAVARQPMPVGTDIGRAIEAIRRRSAAFGAAPVNDAAQFEAVAGFWRTRRLATLKAARLVAFGICLPIRPHGPCVIEDTERFDALLAGIDAWRAEPRWFRRCYQGLVRAYFAYDAEAADAPASGRDNWLRLRAYLHARRSNIVDPAINPDWVTAVLECESLFGASAPGPGAAPMPGSDAKRLEALCHRLGVVNSSWLLRDLILARIRESTTLGDDGFRAVLPELVQTLVGHRLLRDRGLAALLTRHAEIPNPPPEPALRDAAVLAWQTPWMPCNDAAWSGVANAARLMVADWLKHECIDRFFGRFAAKAPENTDDGRQDHRRRAAFWKRYVASVLHLEFRLDAASPSDARAGIPPELMAELTSPSTAGNALVLTLGPIVLVQFGDSREPLSVHDNRKPLPFDLARPIDARPDGANSLKAGEPMLRIAHPDPLPGGDEDSEGWRRWEERTEATLLQQFGIRPGHATPVQRGRFVDLSELSMPGPESVPADPTEFVGMAEDVHWQTAEAASVPYSRSDLEIFARVHALRIDEARGRDGALRVLTADADPRINRVLRRWGFVHRPGQGWWR